MNPKDYEILKKIAQLLATLPSDSLLQKAQTKDQIEEWHKLRKTQILLAECWKAKWLVKNYYPIEEALDKQEISQRKAEFIFLCVDECKARWELCQVAEKYVADLYKALPLLTGYIDQLPKSTTQLWDKIFAQVSLKPYPFKSAYDLFAESLKEDVNDSFSVCLEPYYDVPRKKWGKATKQFTEVLEQAGSNGIYPRLNSREESKLKENLVWNKVKFSWIGMILWTCQIEAFHNDDPLLRQKLVSYNHSLQELLRKQFTASRKLRGWAWIKGELFGTSGPGGVYVKLNKT